MNVGTLFRRAEKVAADNSPAILTGMAVVGVLTTAYLTARATWDAAKIAEQERQHEYSSGKHWDDQRKADQAKLVWKLYIPAAGSAIGTIACVICANRIGTRRTAAMAAAYTLSEKAYTEYKDKVVETLGANKDRKIRDEIAQDRVRRDPPASSLIIGDGKVLMMDSFTGRYFESTVETIKQAMNKINYRINMHQYCSLGDFYSEIGLEGTSYSEEVGWGNGKLMEVTFSTVLTEDGRPCVVINYATDPIRGYHKQG